MNSSDLSVPADGDLSSIGTRVQEVADATERLVDIVPDELTADAETMVDATSTLAAVLAEYNYELTAIYSDPVAAEKIEALNAPEIQAAADRLTEWANEQCGFDNN